MMTDHKSRDEILHSADHAAAVLGILAAVIILLLFFVHQISNTDTLVEFGKFQNEAPHYAWILEQPTKKRQITQTQLSTKYHQIVIPKKNAKMNKPVIKINGSRYHLTSHHYIDAMRETHLTRDSSSLNRLEFNGDIVQLRCGHRYSLLIKEYRTK